jgi:O-antigen ligase
LQILNRIFHAVTWYLILFLVLFSPLAKGSMPDWAITIIYMIVLAALTCRLLDSTLSWNWKWSPTPFDRPVLVLIAVVACATIFSRLPKMSFWAVLLVLNYLALFYLVRSAVSDRFKIKQMIYFIVGIAVFLSIFGIIKKTGHNPFPWWNYAPSGLDRSLALSASTFINPNHFGGYLEMAIPLTLGLVLTRSKGGFRFTIVGAAVIMLTALIMSLSRGGWAGTIVGLIFMMLVLMARRTWFKKHVILSCVGIMLLLSLVALSSRQVVEEIRTITSIQKDDSLLSRVVVWQSVMNMITDYPILGTGPGTFATIFTQYQPRGFNVRFFRAHNEYLQFIAEAGFFTAIILLWLAILFYKEGFRKLEHPSRLVRGTTLGAMSGVTAALFHNFFDFNFHIPANAILFTIMAAIAISPAPKSKRRFQSKDRGV